MSKLIYGKRLLVSDPRVFLNEVSRYGQSLIHYKVNRLSYLLPNGRAYYPRSISLMLTRRCNCRCVMCGQWGKSGYCKNLPSDLLNAQLTLEELKGIVDEVSFFHPSFYLWGGEPLLYPNLIELVEYIKHKKLRCTINTNGILLEKFAQPLVDSGIDSIDVSIDAPAQIHDHIRQFKGAFERATAGIRSIVDIKGESGLEKPRIIIYATISELSYRYIQEVVDITEGLQVDSLTFLYSWFTNEEMGRKYVL